MANLHPHIEQDPVCVLGGHNDAGGGDYPKMTMRKEIVVRLRYEGFHCWPNASEESQFLRERHRHIFHIECWKEVSEDDREIEFISFKYQIESHLESFHHEFDYWSCETIAAHLISQFELSRCGVFEDGENGAFLTV